MDTLLVVFTRRHTLGSVALRWWMHSRWSHCGIYDCRAGTVIEASATGGVREIPFDEFLAGTSHHEIVPIRVRNLAWIHEAARRQLGKPYDWKGIFGFWFRRNWQSDHAFVCSELIAWACTAAGQSLFRREAWRITPEMLYLPWFTR